MGNTVEVQKRTPVTFTVTSGKGGVGKTSLTVNLAFALTQMNHRVLVVDGDLGLANVDVLLRLPVKRTLHDILETGGDPLSAVIRIDPNLRVLPSSSGVPGMLELAGQRHGEIEDLFKLIGGESDFVLVDTAAGIGPSVLWLNNYANHNIIVLTPDPTSMTDAYALIKVLAREHGRTQFLVLLNLVQDEREGEEVFRTLAKVTERFLDLRPHYLGSIPLDRKVAEAVRSQVPFIKRAPGCRAAHAVQQAARRLMEKNVLGVPRFHG